MAKYLPLPNGASLKVPDDMTYEEAVAKAQQRFPELFKPEPASSGGSGLGDIARSFGLGAVGATGALASVFGADSAAARKLSEVGEELHKGMSASRKAELQKQAERMRAAEASGSTWEEIKAGLLNVVEAPVQSAAQAVGSIAPMLATAPLAKIGLGARAIMAARGAIGAAQGAGAVKQNVYEAVLDAEQKDGKSPEQAQAAASAAQAYIGDNLDQILLGGGLGFGAGITGVERMLPGGVKATAGAAQQAIAKRIGERGASALAGAAGEMPLEGLQGGQERLAANLALQRTGRDVDALTGVAGQATQEALLGALGGGAFGAVLPDRSASVAAAQQREEEKRKADMLRQQQQATEQARLNTPEYALDVAQRYAALEQQLEDLKGELRKGTKDRPLTAEDKVFNSQITTQLRQTGVALNALAIEKNRVTQSGLLGQAQAAQQQAQEQARLEGLSPMDYLLEQAGEVPETKIAPTTPDMAGFEMPEPVVPSAVPEIERQKLQEYAAESIALADEQRMSREKDFASAAFDYVQYLMRDPTRADEMVKTRTPMPDLSKKQSDRVLDALELHLDAYKTKLAQEAAVGNRSAQARLAALESEESEAGAFQMPEAEQLAPGVGSEIMALQRMAAQPAGVSDQFDLFGQPGQPQAPSAAIGQMQQRLTGEDVTFTGEEAQRAQRGEAAPFALRGRAEGTAAPVTRDDLADRINRVLTTYDLSPEAVDFLRRVEQTLPQSDTTITREPQMAVVRGKLVRVGQDTGSYFDLINRQLERIESGEEGVPQKGQRRSIELQAFPTGEARAETAPPTEATAEDIKQFRSAQPGQARTMTQMEQAALEKRRAEGKGGRLPGFVYQPEEGERVATTAGPTPVKKRVTEMTPDTLRGASALPQDLSMARDVEEQLRLLETVADEGVQRPLFPEEQESVKLTRAGFQTYLKSPKVEALRKALRRDQEILKRAEQIPELEKRAKALVDEIDGILKSYAEYRSADAIVQANKDVNQARRDIAEIRAAAGKATVNRMMLAGRVQQLQEARRDVVEEGRRQGETVEPDFLAELDAVTEAMQEAQTDLSLLDSALSTLDGQLRSFTALKKMSALVDQSVDPERIPAAQRELQAVKTELEKLREDYNEVNNRLRKEAADRKRAEAAVKEAERKATIEAGRVKPIEEMKQQLPEYDRAVQYPAITEAQRLAREKGGALPELSEAEKIRIKGEPTQVLGGYRKEVTRLEKAIQKAQNSARESLRAQIVGPKQEAFDRVNKQYKAAKSAAERDAIGPRLDVAQKLLARAEDKVKTAPITWRGMKRDIAQLASAINKVDWLEGMISSGRIEVEAPQVAVRRAKEAAAAKQAESERKVREATARAEAPATSGEALTRSEAAKARQPQKTLFEGKGMPGGAAKEIGAPTTFEKMQKVAAERAKRGVYRVSEGGKGIPMDALGRLINRITGSWKNVPTIVAAANFDALPEKIKAQAIADGVAGNIPGVYDPDTKTVYLVADALHSAEDVIATVAHEIAGHFGLREMLRGEYAKVMNDVYNGNKAVREKADAKMAGMPSLSREVAVEEVLADMAEADPNAQGKGGLRTVYNAIKRWFRETFGLDNVSDKAVQQIVANARNYVIEGGAVAQGAAETGKATYRTKAEPNALTDLADKISAPQKTFKDRWGKLTALEGEMQGVDMRAGLRDTLKAGAEGLGDPKLFTQTMYNVLKADQKMPLVYTVMSRGPLELYKDESGLHGVRSTNKNSAVDVFEAINNLPGDDAKQKMAMAQAYLVAQRAENKGLQALDTGALGVKESDLKAALDAAKADKELGTALEKVRRVYNAYNKGMIDFLAATGAIPKAVAEKLNAAGDYVPFYRVDANGKADLVFTEDAMVTIGDIRRQPYLAELKGGETKLLPLDEAIPRNTILLTDKALTNMATKSVAYGLQAIGKDAGKMQIRSGKAPADPGIIKFNQEPDPNNPSDNGERWVKVDTEGTMAEGVPTALLVKSLEGAHMPLPGFLKFAGKATDLLRAGVTRTPLYIARQLLREPMSAAFTGGLNYNTFTAVLKAGKEFVKMTRGTSEAEAKLLEKGLIQSGIFTGDVDDMGKFALQLVKGDQNAMEKLFAITDKAAIKADAATRALVYENALANGLSEVEADMMTMESMNFYKRGLSPTVQYASRLIPFLNAQIQGLNVLYKAATGKMPFEEQQRIKRKFFNNAALLAATGMVYAMAMEDDETWRNARPRDKMSNFFIPLPGTDEMLKLPIPFEAGYFYSLAVAAVEGMREQTDGKAQWAALRDLFLNSIPGYSSMGVPQIVKPVAEIWTNKNFLSGAPIESLRLQGLNPEERYNATTTEFAKMLSRAVPILSPIQIEHLVRGYLGVLPLAAVAAANDMFAKEGAGPKPEKRLSEMALLGSAFQKKFGGADADVVFEAAKEAMDARTTLNKMLAEGRREDAAAYRNENRADLLMAGPAGQYRQLVGRINADVRRTQERTDLNAQEKRQRIDRLEEAKQKAAEQFLAARRRAEEAASRTTPQ